MHVYPFDKPRTTKEDCRHQILAARMYRIHVLHPIWPCLRQSFQHHAIAKSRSDARFTNKDVGVVLIPEAISRDRVRTFGKTAALHKQPVRARCTKDTSLGYELTRIMTDFEYRCWLSYSYQNCSEQIICPSLTPPTPIRLRVRDGATRLSSNTPLFSGVSVKWTDSSHLWAHSMLNTTSTRGESLISLASNCKFYKLGAQNSAQPLNAEAK